MIRMLLAVVAVLTIGAAPVDWTKTVTRAPNGAYVLGNPKAKVRLVEYLSYSCDHCAHFTGESAAPLKSRYVKTGNVAVEFRNAVRDRYDFATALLARCGGPSRFFTNSEALFAEQARLMAQASAFEARSSPPENSPVNTVLANIAQGSGLVDFMAEHGVTPAAANACLTDKVTQDVVLAMTTEAWQVRKIAGTPTILINGQPSGAGDWATLEPKLRAAIAAR